MLLNVVEVSVIVEQLDFVSNRDRSDHAVNGFPNGNTSFPQGSIDLCGVKMHGLCHGKKRKILKIAFDLSVLSFFSYAL